MNAQLKPDFCEDCFNTGRRFDSGGYRLCDCSVGQNIRAEDLRKMVTQAEIPPRYTNCTFDNFKPQNESQIQARIIASTFAANFPTERGLLFVGTVGTGKTHLSAAALRTIIATKRVAGFFIEFSELLVRIQASWDPAAQTTQWALLSRVSHSPIVVLDEVGARRLTDWARDILYTIINGRYNRKLLTIFTTNYLDTPTPGDEMLEDRIGERLRSRLHEMCKTVEVNGPDYRKIKGRKIE